MGVGDLAAAFLGGIADSYGNKIKMSRQLAADKEKAQFMADLQQQQHEKQRLMDDQYNTGQAVNRLNSFVERANSGDYGSAGVEIAHSPEALSYSKMNPAERVAAAKANPNILQHLNDQLAMRNKQEAEMEQYKPFLPQAIQGLGGNLSPQSASGESVYLDPSGNMLDPDSLTPAATKYGVENFRTMQKQQDQLARETLRNENKLSAQQLRDQQKLQAQKDLIDYKRNHPMPSKGTGGGGRRSKSSGASQNNYTPFGGGDRMVAPKPAVSPDDEKIKRIEQLMKQYGK